MIKLQVVLCSCFDVLPIFSSTQSMLLLLWVFEERSLLKFERLVRKCTLCIWSRWRQAKKLVVFTRPRGPQGCKYCLVCNSESLYIDFSAFFEVILTFDAFKWFSTS
jgi:hypothetical protein